MRARIPAFCVFAVVLGAALWACADDVAGLLEKAAVKDGGDYIRFRDRVVSLGLSEDGGKQVVLALQTIAIDAREEWQLRLLAHTCLERIQKAGQLKELIARDWSKDAEYDKQFQNHQSDHIPSDWLLPLLQKRYEKEGLWHHYAEMFWKKTGEHSAVYNMTADNWDRLMMLVLQESPARSYLAKVLESRIEEDPEQKDPRTKSYFAFLINELSDSAFLPYLLDAWARGEGKKMEHFEKIIAMADPDDLPVLERFLKNVKLDKESRRFLKKQIKLLKKSL